MKLYVAGFGPGSREGMTIEAVTAIEGSDLVVGYTVYTELMRDIFPEKKFYSTSMRQERERVIYALERAAEGLTVSLICSGDGGVYGMAGLALELAEDYPDVDVEIVAGVTAAISGAALLGAPLGHDFAVISLSDLLTSWEKIERRLECAAMGDFAVAIYNPSSKKRSEHLKKACEIMLKFKAENTVCGYVKNIGREGETYDILTLSELKNFEADMFTTVFIGSAETTVLNGKMVTPRGYKNV